MNSHAVNFWLAALIGAAAGAVYASFFRANNDTDTTVAVSNQCELKAASIANTDVETADGTVYKIDKVRIDGRDFLFIHRPARFGNEQATIIVVPLLSTNIKKENE